MLGVECDSSSMLNFQHSTFNTPHSTLHIIIPNIYTPPFYTSRIKTYYL